MLIRSMRPITTKNNPTPFKKDFNPDPNLDLFYSFFGMPKTEQNIIDLSQDSDKFRHIQLINPTDCGSEIMSHFTVGQTKGLWIEGNCHINASVAANLNTAQLLVIHDGAFALNGAMTYNGVIYHLVDYANSITKSRIDDFGSRLSLLQHLVHLHHLLNHYMIQL